MKLHTGFQLSSKLVTLNDLERGNYRRRERCSFITFDKPSVRYLCPSIRLILCHIIIARRAKPRVKYFTLTSSLIMRSDVNLIWLLFW